MAGETLHLDDIIHPDSMATQIAQKWQEWKTLKKVSEDQATEIRQYVFATDTTQTTNSKNPWKNKTTIPKLCQIRDNLFANYMAALFPKRKWLTWEANEKDANNKAKRDSIKNYMNWVISQSSFKEEMEKLLLDYIDYGNAFAMPYWIDQTIETEEGQFQTGYVGPAVRRIAPQDIVFNPIASSFEKSPKIIRSFVTMGDVQEILQSNSTDQNKEEYKKLLDYLMETRQKASTFAGTIQERDAFYQVDGYTSFQQYLGSDYVELLTFYGDIWDWESKTYLKNHIVQIVDRHKIISKKPNPSYFGYPPIFHVGWRKRQDNLWAMSPLANLVGLQYRMDHVENLKADVFDLIAFPVTKIKGAVDDFEWGPGERIYVSEEGDVDLLQPPFQLLQYNQEVQYLAAMMEEMAGSPKEAMGFRTPGEKTAFEVQRLENAGSRIFQSKITHFEEKFEERILNGMLELARRFMSGTTSISAFDDEFKFTTFMELTPGDLVGAGRIKPVGARHFAERAEKIQNLTTWAQSPMGQDQEVLQHFSSVKQAQMIEKLFDLQEEELIIPYVRISERAESQRLMNTASEKVAVEAGTATGIGDDYDLPADGGEPPPDQVQAEVENLQ